jgi:hypothetical protein
MQSRPQKTDQRFPCYVQFATAIRGWTAGRSRYVHDSFMISRPPELQLQPGNDAIHQEFNGAALNTRYVIPPGIDLARPQLQRNETNGPSSVDRVFVLLHWPRQQEDRRPWGHANRKIASYAVGIATSNVVSCIRAAQNDSCIHKGLVVIKY